MLKSQHELSRINLVAPRDNPPVFRVYDFTARSGAAGTAVHCALDRDGQFTITATQGGRTYQAKLPFKGETLADLTASVRLSDTAATLDVDLSGKDFLDGVNLPQDFRDLHQRIVRHVQRNLGWLSKGHNVQSKGSEASQADSDTISNTATTDQESQYRVRRTTGPDQQFQGKRIGLVRSVEHNGRYWQFSVFETEGGNFVGVKEGLTRWFGELPKVETVVVKSRGELSPFFGDSSLARALYEQVCSTTSLSSSNEKIHGVWASASPRKGSYSAVLALSSSGFFVAGHTNKKRAQKSSLRQKPNSGGVR